MKASSLHSEISRRASHTAQVLALFKTQALIWIPWHEIAAVGGACGWRTRISNCRKIVQKAGGDIVWNEDAKDSRYMYIPFRPLGRPAHEFVAQKDLF